MVDKWPPGASSCVLAETQVRLLPWAFAFCYYWIIVLIQVRGFFWSERLEGFLPHLKGKRAAFSCH